VKLQDTVNLRLDNNFTFDTAGLQWIMTWQSLQRYNVWFCKTKNYSGLKNLQQH